MELRPPQYSHLPSPGQSFPKVNASYLNLLIFSAEMQQVHDSCDDHGSGDHYPACGASSQHEPPEGAYHEPAAWKHSEAFAVLVWQILPRHTGLIHTNMD